jgi:hypothetical protein
VWASSTTISARPYRPIGSCETSTIEVKSKTRPPAIHRARGARLDAGEVRAGLRQHALDEETAGDELGGHALARAGGSGGELRPGGLRHAGPHVAERDQAEEMHVVGRAGARVIGLGERVLGEPHGRLVQGRAPCRAVRHSLQGRVGGGSFM